VLFESAAAGTPFLSVPVGNAVEIARWTGAGVICPAPQDGRGYTKVDSKILGEYWSRLVKDRANLRQLGAAGKEKWAERFTWQDITEKYEQVFRKVSIDE
jgi:glycosyltransferase involved in cell wall biosynthesis